MAGFKKLQLWRMLESTKSFSVVIRCSLCVTEEDGMFIRTFTMLLVTAGPIRRAALILFLMIQWRPVFLAIPSWAEGRQNGKGVKNGKGVRRQILTHRARFWKDCIMARSIRIWYPSPRSSGQSYLLTLRCGFPRPPCGRKSLASKLPSPPHRLQFFLIVVFVLGFLHPPGKRQTRAAVAG